MSVKSVKDSRNSDNGKRWAALDSRLERLVNPSDRLGADAGDSDRACDLKVAS
jgi:hypothetical protein